MAPGFHITQQSPCVNLFANPIREQNELIGNQGLARKSDASSNKAPIFSETPILPLILSPAKDLFLKFMKIFIETTQV